MLSLNGRLHSCALSCAYRTILPGRGRTVKKFMTRKTIAWATVVGLAIVAGAVFLPDLINKTDASASAVCKDGEVKDKDGKCVSKDDDPAKQVCEDVDEEPRFLAYDPATKRNNFGPPVKSTSKDEVLAELHRRLCVDPALTSALTLYATGGDLRTYKQLTKQFQGDYLQWGEAVKTFDKVIADAQSVKILEASAGYNSLWFKVSGSDQTVVPALAQGPISGRKSTLLVITTKDGKTLRLRLECGFQPYEVNFPGIPSVKTPPKETPSGGCKHNCGGNPTPECKPPYVPSTTGCLKPKGQNDPGGSGGNGSPYKDPVDNHKQGGTKGADKNNPPPKDTDPVRQPDGNGQSGAGSPGNGGAGPATGPADNSHSGDNTTVDNPPPCPMGPGNC